MSSFNVRSQIYLAAVFSISYVFGAAVDSSGNRLAYLDGSDPFYVHRNFPKLTTPQWVGEKGVDAVVILAIDDLRDHAKYETFLRPILDRLKKIDGRAPVSIYCNTTDANQPHLRTWLKEGLSLEVHTLTHPCPLLARSNFVASAETYHGCVDLLSRISGNKPVAFRMPCCDSMNSPSPRFYSELFNGVSAETKFLTIDSSVMNIPTPNDTSIPRELVMENDGRERFRKYLPFPSFVTTIEDYPYPYVIGKKCWEFPAMVPSDWEAQNRHGVNNARTVADWKAALDLTVLKQGAFTFIFHPHGWIRPDQLVDFIDYATDRYGSRVKFLNFREAQERIDRHLLAGNPLRDANGEDNGVRLIDLNNDGFLDVLIGRDLSSSAADDLPADQERASQGVRQGSTRLTRLWNGERTEWVEQRSPVAFVVQREDGKTEETGARFGLGSDGVETICLMRGGQAKAGGAWRFANGQWVEDKSLLNGLEVGGSAILTSRDGKDRGVRFRDTNRDGGTELIVSNSDQQAIFGYSDSEKRWKSLSFALPSGATIVDENGLDNGLRFVDLNEDGFEDVIFSNPKNYGVYLFTPKPAANLKWDLGWSQKIREGKGDDLAAVPKIVRSGPHRNNGVWFHSRQMWIQNEEVAHLPDKVDRRSFQQLIAWDAPPPKSPEESRQSIHVRPGFQVELAAHEPLTQDPVAFEWGADGRLWVAEMVDYPVGIGEKGTPGGTVRFLEDRDGDGRYDHSTLFLEGLNYPNGVMPWRKGVLVSAAPEIFYAEDTDGDGKADVRTRLLEGFGEGNQQHRVNGFDFGLDNWVYAANGDSGGMIRSILTGKRLDIRGRDFRFRPDTGAFETVAGQTQFGRRRDDWGNWFGNNNPNWVWHYYLPEHYLVRNPHLAVRDLRRMLANYPNSTRALAISPLLQRFNWPDMINIVTSANSAAPYRDDLFGPDFATSIFVSEPANNLIHREVLVSEGVTFTSHRPNGEEDREFLASTDNWFRPTMIRTGPDGALYFADMYRLVIEHIAYGLPGMEKQIDLRAGFDRGRIFRVAPAGKPLRKTPRLDQLEGNGLVDAMDSANGWQRDTVQRLLVERADASVAPNLLRLATRSSNPKVRLQALCTLDGLGTLTSGIIEAATHDTHSAVREHAVRLSEPILRELSGTARDARRRQLADRMVQMTHDPDIRVRYQLAFTLGEWKDPQAADALVAIALRDIDDSRVLTAVLSSATPHIGPMLDGVTRNPERLSSRQAQSFVEQLFSMAVLMKQDDALAAALQNIVSSKRSPSVATQIGALAGILNALERRNQSLQDLEKSATPALRKALASFDQVFDSAEKAALDGQTAEADRVAAIRLIGRRAATSDLGTRSLAQLLRPQQPIAIQKAALENLARSKHLAAGELLLQDWKSFSPGIRVDVLNAMLSRLEWSEALLAAIEGQRIAPGQIGTTHQQKLLTHTRASIRQRAANLFAREADRQAVLNQFQGVASLSGDQERGAALFRQHCAMCHRVKNEGIRIGPDLETFAGKPVSDWVLAILDPNQIVEAPFVSFTAVTASERELSGIIISESANSITLRIAGGAEETILRNELTSLTSSGLSLMPDGFEKAFRKQDLADLIRFVTSRE